MRFIFAIMGLVASTTAQISFATTPAATSNIEVEPTQTEALSGPINTARACAQIQEYIDEVGMTYPSVGAELAYACLKSVPIDTDTASRTIDSLKQFIEFQSTLSYLKDPPEGYANEGVDLIAGLNDIQNTIKNGNYESEHDFEEDIANLLMKAHDGHLNFDGFAFAGVFRWRRNREVSLISGSKDGREAPKVWATRDYNRTGDAGFTPSAVVQIDGIDVVQFLQQEAERNAYHDPDTRWNALFYLPAAENSGYFTNPRFYPGPSMNMTFENGTTLTFPNAAIVWNVSSWSNVTDGQAFYDTFVLPTGNLFSKRDAAPHNLPRHLDNPRESELARRYVPFAYPEPVVEHSSAEVGLAGYFLETSVGTVGVLLVTTFNTRTISGNVEFQLVVQRYIAQAKERNVVQHIIDLRTNGGGKVLLGYDMYLQFFPSQEPQLMSRYRGSRGASIFGESISSLEEITLQNGQLWTSPFNYHSYVKDNLDDFSNWLDLMPPVSELWGCKSCRIIKVGSKTK